MDAKSRRRLRTAAWFFLSVAAVFVFATAVIGIFLLSVIADSALHVPKEKVLLQRISDPRSNSDFLLMTNGRLQDRAWFVYSVPTGSPPSGEMLAQTGSGPAILFNYAESANHCTDERLEVVETRYLVFWRGGVRHSLFDLQARKVLFNVEAPWFDYPHVDGKRPTPEEFHEWALVAMDQKIQMMLDERLD